MPEVQEDPRSLSEIVHNFVPSEMHISSFVVPNVSGIQADQSSDIPDQ